MTTRTKIITGLATLAILLALALTLAWLLKPEDTLNDTSTVRPVTSQPTSNSQSLDIATAKPQFMEVLTRIQNALGYDRPANQQAAEQVCHNDISASLAATMPICNGQRETRWEASRTGGPIGIYNLQDKNKDRAVMSVDFDTNTRAVFTLAVEFSKEDGTWKVNAVCSPATSKGDLNPLACLGK